jgi:hypothetical protein
MDQNKTDNSRSAPAKPEGMALEVARSRLTAIWLAGSGVMFAVLVLQSIVGKYGGRLQQVWSWFIQPARAFQPAGRSYAIVRGVELLADAVAGPGSRINRSSIHRQRKGERPAA